MILTEKNIQEIYKYILEKGGVKDSQFETKYLSNIDKDYIYIPIIYDTPEEGIKYDNGKLLYKNIEDTITSNILHSTRLITFDGQYTKDGNLQSSPFIFYIQGQSKQPYYKIAYGDNSPFYIAYGNTTIDANQVVYQKLIDFGKKNYQSKDSEFGGSLEIFGWTEKKQFSIGLEHTQFAKLTSDTLFLQNTNTEANLYLKLTDSSKYKSGFSGLDIYLSTSDIQNGIKAGIRINDKTANDILTAAGTTTTCIYDLNLAKNSGQPFKNSLEVENVLLDRDLNINKDIRLFKAYIQEDSKEKYLSFCIKSYKTVAVDFDSYYVSQYYFLKDIVYYRKLKFNANGTQTVIKDWITLFKDGQYKIKTINGKSLMGDGNIQINSSSSSSIIIQ